MMHVLIDISFTHITAQKCSALTAKCELLNIQQLVCMLNPVTLHTI